MLSVTLVLLGAGSSSRFDLSVKKQWIWSADKPLWLQVLDDFAKIYHFEKIIMVSSKEDIQAMDKFCQYQLIEGGNSRQESLKNALKFVETSFVMVSDVARCCLDVEMISRVIEAKKINSCVVPTLKMTDTAYYNNAPIDRECVKIIQTPQLSDTTLLKEALQSSKEFTDDSSAIAFMGGEVIFVDGSALAHKLTTIEDLKKLPCLKAPSTRPLVGFGIDIHGFEEAKVMVLGGVKITSTFGFKAHSDGDVAIHAIIDALLGASGLGDIGEFYPDTSSEFKNIDSKVLLLDTVRKIATFGYEIGNVDITIIAQKPRLDKHKKEIRFELSKLLGITPNKINIKATTAEKMGFIGRSEGVCVEAVASLFYVDWRER
ncbi:MAG: 2-C-methyl-D-erythritol 4-phosphate cytidylyltransferase [Sulfurovum sp. AS07-7]|nr:MAG: 2-C-methyl-D-erythritol 4-phosphate cytidylyltransferase [Sulfurovum sp. AS07-7]